MPHPSGIKKLEAKYKQIQHLSKISTESETHEDARVIKHLKNKHTTEGKKGEKAYQEDKLKTNLGKWKTLREIEINVEKSL